MLLYNILVVPFSLTLGHIFIVIPAGVYPPLAEAGIQKGFNSKKEHKNITAKSESVKGST